MIEEIDQHNAIVQCVHCWWKLKGTFPKCEAMCVPHRFFLA